MDKKICPKCGSNDTHFTDSRWATYYQCWGCFKDFGTVKKSEAIERAVGQRDTSDHNKTYYDD